MNAREVVAAFCDALSDGDYEGAEALLTDDVGWWVGGVVPGLSGQRRGEEVRALVRNVLALSVDGRLHVTPRAWTVDDDRVALEALVEATLKTGRNYRNEYHFAFEVHGDRVRSVRAYLDTEELRASFLGKGLPTQRL